MTIGAPCVEWEQCTQHTESDEDEGEEDVLDIARNAVVGCNCGQLKGIAAAVDYTGPNTPLPGKPKISWQLRVSPAPTTSPILHKKISPQMDSVYAWESLKASVAYKAQM